MIEVGRLVQSVHGCGGSLLKIKFDVVRTVIGDINDGTHDIFEAAVIDPIDFWVHSRDVCSLESRGV